MIKQTSLSLDEGKTRYRKAPVVQEKETLTQTLLSWSQTKILNVESDSQIDSGKRVHAIITSDKCIVSNLMEVSDSSSTDLSDD